jgi:hypothetical protein
MPTHIEFNIKRILIDRSKSDAYFFEKCSKSFISLKFSIFKFILIYIFSLKQINKDIRFGYK